MKKTLIIAHRGASNYAPENTMAAFIKALHMGAEGIEIDVHLSKDGEIVVIHDERVDRTSNGHGWVKDMTLKELKSLDFGSWFSNQFKGETIPTLEEVLGLLSCRNVMLNIELKSGPVLYPGIEKKVIQMLSRYGMMDRTIISSFNHYSLIEAKRIEPGVKIGLLYMAGLVAPWKYASSIGAYALHPLFYGVTPDLVESCHEFGIAVNPFTVDDREAIKKMVACSVDGIITNVPDVAIKVRNSMV